MKKLVCCLTLLIGMIWTTAAVGASEPTTIESALEGLTPQTGDIDQTQAETLARTLCGLPEMGNAAIEASPRIVQNSDGSWFLELFPRMAAMPCDVWLTRDGTFAGYLNTAVTWGDGWEDGDALTSDNAQNEWAQYLSDIIAAYFPTLAQQYEAMEVTANPTDGDTSFVQITLLMATPKENWQAVLQVAPEKRVVALYQPDREVPGDWKEYSAGGDRSRVNDADAQPHDSKDPQLNMNSAVDIAKKTLMTERGLTEDEVNSMELAEAYIMDYTFPDTGRSTPAWLICYSLGDDRTPFDYSVILDAYTGQIYQLRDPSSIGNG